MQPAEDDAENTPSFTVTTHREGNVLFLTLSGEVDLHNVAALREALATGLQDRQCVEVIADIGDVPFMDSSGYGAFLGVMQQLAPRGGHVRFVRCHPYVARMLDVTRLNRAFEIHDSIEEAREAVREYL